jgi:peptidoglycan/xylan/chitin deacetylase (PgdA/CDA1 family)
MVLAYHAISDDQRPLFARQMDELIRKTTPIHADVDALPANTGRFSVITFDDGLENIIPNALPELKKRNIPCTLFIVTDKLGCERSWEHMGGEDTSKLMVMSREQLCSLPSDLVKIGSHTMTHPLLPKVEKSFSQQELSGSREKLEKILNCDVRLFSFPYGGFNDSVIEDCRIAKYDRVFTAYPVLAFSQPGEFVTGRVSTAPTDWPIEFRLKLAGSYRWLPWAFQVKRRIRSLLKGGAGKSLAVKTGEKRAA